MVYSLNDMNRMRRREALVKGAEMSRRQSKWLFWFGILIGVACVLHRWNGLASAAQPNVSYTVHAGDTVWGIASRVSHGQDPRIIMDEIIDVNHLGGNVELIPGQVLRLPAGLSK